MEWTGARYADMPTVKVQTWIDAPPDRVWRVVADISLMPELSDELQSVEWVSVEEVPRDRCDVPRPQQARCPWRMVHPLPHRRMGAESRIRLGSRRSR